MSLLVTRLILTAILLAVGYFSAVHIWTSDIDVPGFFKGWAKKLIPVREQAVDVLLPARQQTPPFHLPPARSEAEGGPPQRSLKMATTVADSEMVLFLGNLAVSTAENEYVVLRLYGKDVLKISKAKTGISVSADIWDESGKISATMENNRFRVNPNNTLPIIRPDEHTLIVEDERKIRVLSVRFLNPTTIKIEGVFRGPGKYPLVIDESSMTFGPVVIKGGVAFHLKGRTIFEWPGTLSEDFAPPIGPQTTIKEDQARLKLTLSGGVAVLSIEDSQGSSFSLMQLGGSDLPEGYRIMPLFAFRFKAPSEH